MKQSILVTGVSGFIGSRMALRAKQEGHRVFGASRTHSEYLTTQLDIPVLTLDVLNTIDNMPEVDTIIHCATANDMVSKDFDAGMIQSVIGTHNLLDAARKIKVKNFLFFSTLQVYGTELNGIYDEDTPVRCESPYALNHYFGEEVCRMYSSLYGINVVIIRPSNVYGTPDVSTINRGTLVPMCFVNEVLRQQTITLLSSGNQMRNFVSTDEVADAVLKVILNIPNGCLILNIGTDWNCSIINIAKIVAKTYEQEFGLKVNVNVKTDMPNQSNSFKIHSQLSYLRNLPQNSASCMQSTIVNLFRQLQRK